MIKKILVANRGEIAVRVMRTCREMGIPSVAVFSSADRYSLHVRYADEAVFIGPPSSMLSYLHMDRIICAAKSSGADAIHPGYGFLSENAEFADRCKQEGIIFIGPSSYAMRTMGDKITARQKMVSSGVPVVPGSPGDINKDEDIVHTVKEIGLPVMIKASAGGGGKGMRLVRHEKDILNFVRAAKSEALTAFGNDSVYIEKYIESPHHIEFQILADQHGHVIHICERECSVQRRHQKVIEETPSPIMTPELRAEMGAHAVAAAKSVNYEGAGTIEFLVDANLKYYFLEMNTRLQVEHPITERATGIDLVKEQIRIANGEPLAYKQEDIKQTGHAIECRIYAEDPDNNFMPSPGTIKHIIEPMGLGVRIDGYVYKGYKIPIHYDPMISKMIVWAQTREGAIKRMARALSEYKITGVKTSIKFLKKIMTAPDFVNGKYDTHFIENNHDFLFKPEPDDPIREDMAMIASYIDYMLKIEAATPKVMSNSLGNNWKDLGRKKNVLRF
jgi:acetyl-CoA carboxylase, biotin carboxylase subunit